MTGLDLQRKPEWQALLNVHLVESQRRYADHGLEWGVFDCCTFAADWVVSATGVDPLKDYRGAYASMEEAMTALRVNGDGALVRALTRLFGPPVAPALGKRGDLAFRKAERAVGIVATSGPRQVAYFLGDNGFAALRMRDIDGAFRVG